MSKSALVGMFIEESGAHKEIVIGFSVILSQCFLWFHRVMYMYMATCEESDNLNIFQQNPYRTDIRLHIHHTHMSNCGMFIQDTLECYTRKLYFVQVTPSLHNYTMVFPVVS